MRAPASMAAAERGRLTRELQQLRRRLTYPAWQADVTGLDISYPHAFRSRMEAVRQKQLASSGLSYPGWQQDFAKLDVNYPSLIRGEAAALPCS